MRLDIVLLLSNLDSARAALLIPNVTISARFRLVILKWNLKCWDLQCSTYCSVRSRSMMPERLPSITRCRQGGYAKHQGKNPEKGAHKKWYSVGGGFNVDSLSLNRKTSREHVIDFQNACRCKGSSQTCAHFSFGRSKSFGGWSSAPCSLKCFPSP